MADMDADRLVKSCWRELEAYTSDQERGLPAPPAQPVPPEGSALIDLPGINDMRAVTPGPDLTEILRGRRSRRSFRGGSIPLEQMAYLLWATQGTLKILSNGASFRTSPSGGARHPLDTWLIVRDVEGLEPGLYAYLPLEHRLWRKAAHPGREALIRACNGQRFTGDAQVVFAWSAVPARTSWRYGPATQKLVAIDAGHICQNLYLACGFLNLGTCAVGAYLQEEMDALLGLDGRDEFTVYLAPVGRLGEA